MSRTTSFKLVLLGQYWLSLAFSWCSKLLRIARWRPFCGTGESAVGKSSLVLRFVGHSLGNVWLSLTLFCALGAKWVLRLQVRLDLPLVLDPLWLCLISSGNQLSVSMAGFSLVRTYLREPLYWRPVPLSLYLHSGGKLSWVNHHAMVNLPLYIITAAFLTQSVHLDESTTIKFEIWDTVSALLDEPVYAYQWWLTMLQAGQERTW